jgi:LysM domain-containing protein
MSVLTTGKPSRLTRAAAPARQRAGTVGTHRPGRAGRGAVRHLRVVPDTGLPGGTQTAPENERPQGAPSVREAGPVTVPRPRRPADVRRPGDVRQPGDVRRPGDAVQPGAVRQPGDIAQPGAVRQPGNVRRPGDVRRAGSGQGLRHSADVPDARLAPRRNTVRLTRRGRLVVTVMLTAVCLSLVVLAWLAIAARAAQATDGGQSPGAVYQNLTSVVVHPGQTLWSIASQAEPTADPRAVMQQIIELNALHGTNVVPGQRLWVPRG